VKEEDDEPTPRAPKGVDPGATPKGSTKKDEAAAKKKISAEDHARVKAVGDKILAGGEGLTHDDVATLIGHAEKNLNAKQLKELVAAVKSKISGTKAQLADRIIAYAKGKATGGTAAAPEAKPAPVAAAKPAPVPAAKPAPVAPVAAAKPAPAPATKPAATKPVAAEPVAAKAPPGGKVDTSDFDYNDNNTAFGISDVKNWQTERQFTNHMSKQTPEKRERILNRATEMKSEREQAERDKKDEFNRARASRRQAQQPVSGVNRNHNVTKKGMAALDKADLSPDTKKKFAAAFDRAVDRIPKAGMDRIGRHLGDIKFASDFKAIGSGVADGILNDQEGFRSKVKAKGLPDSEADATIEMCKTIRDSIASGDVPAMVGCYDTINRSMHLDGAAIDPTTGRPLKNLEDGLYSVTGSEHEVYAHELAHAIDGPDKEYSGSADWQEAFASEIGYDGRGGPIKLTDYGASEPSEGFAEFARTVFGGEASLDMVEKDFPKASQFFRDKGLWPESNSGPASGGAGKPRELFDKDKRVDLGAGGHGDVLKDRPAATDPKRTVPGK